MCLPAAAYMSKILSITSVLASKGLASPSKLDSMADVKRLPQGKWSEKLSGGKETMFETSFFSVSRKKRFLPKKQNKAVQLISQKKPGGAGWGRVGQGGAGQARGVHGEGRKIHFF